MEFTESKLPCYNKGDAYETDNFMVVHYDWSTHGGMMTKKHHWRAYKLPSGLYVDGGGGEYTTRSQAEQTCLKSLRRRG